MLYLLNSCKAGDNAQVKAIKKQCRELSKQTDEEHLYGEGVLKYFGENVPPAHTPQKHDKPLDYIAIFEYNNKKKLRFGISGKWQDLSVLGPMLKLAPLEVDMEKESFYGFCYKLVKPKNTKRIFYIIEHPKTIQQIKD